MTLPRRRWLLGAAVLVAVLAVAPLARLASLDGEAIRRETDRLLENALGLAVESGKVSLSLGWELGIGADDLRIANLPGRESPYLLEAERVDLSLRIGPLLRGRIDVHGIEFRGATLRIEPAGEAAQAAPKPDWDALEEGSEGGSVHLAVRKLTAEGLVVLVGSPADARRIRFDEVFLKARGPHAERVARLRGDVDGARFHLFGRLGSASGFTDPAERFPVELEGIAFGAEWRIQASLQDPLALAGLEVTALSMTTRGAEAHASGRVVDARAFRGVDLAVKAEVSDVSLLDEWLGSRLPRLEALDVAGSLRDTDGSLGFEGRVVATARGGDVVLELDGVHGNLDDVKELDAAFVLRAADTEALLRVAGVELDLPRIPSVTAEGRVHGAGGVLGASGVVLEAGSDAGLRLSARGSLQDLVALRGVQVSAEFGAFDATALSQWAGRPLPLTGALRGSLDLSDADGSLGIDRLSLSDAQNEGVVDFKLDLVAGDLRGGGDVVIDAEISSEGLHHMGTLAGVGLPPVGPATWKGRLRGRARSLSVEGVLTVAQTAIHGRGSWQDDAAGRHNLRAALRSGEVRLADLGVAPHGWAATGDDRFGWARSTRVLDFETLRGFDATVTLDADRVVGRRGYAAQDMHFDFDLRQGLLSLRYNETLDDSPLALRFSADVTREQPVLTLHVESQRFDVNIPAAQLEDDPRFSGVIDFEATLQGRGTSAEAVRRSLSGNVLVTGRDGTLASHYARAFFQDLFVRVLQSGRQRPPSRWRCAKGDLVIEQGVIRARELFIDLHGVHLDGSGSVDLADGRWDLVIRPRVYGPGLIGGGATVEVAGPLAKPTFRVRARSVPVSMGQTLASRILSPLELAARPITGTRDVCAGIP